MQLFWEHPTNPFWPNQVLLTSYLGEGKAPCTMFHDTWAAPVFRRLWSHQPSNPAYCPQVTTMISGCLTVCLSKLSTRNSSLRKLRAEYQPACSTKSTARIRTTKGGKNSLVLACSTACGSRILSEKCRSLMVRDSHNCSTAPGATTTTTTALKINKTIFVPRWGCFMAHVHHKYIYIYILSYII